jgi:hypothetical protein
MKPASRCTIAMDIARCVTLAEPQKLEPTAAGISGIEIQSSFDLVSLVQSSLESKACYYGMRSSRYASAAQVAWRCRALGCPVHLIKLREARIKHMRPIVEAWRFARLKRILSA